MSTPISDLPDDVDELDDGRDFSPVKRGKRGKIGFFRKNQDLLFIFIAVIVASFVNLDAFRFSVPRQVFVMGDAPINALMVVLLYVIIRLILKNMAL